MRRISSTDLARTFFCDVLNGGDVVLAHALLDPRFAGHGGFVGLDLPAARAVGSWLDAFRVAFPDGRYVVDSIGGTEERVVVATTFKGTHAGPYLGRPATGAAVVVTGVHMLRVDAGLIVEHRGYENLWALRDALEAAHPLAAPAW